MCLNWLRLYYFTDFSKFYKILRISRVQNFDEIRRPSFKQQKTFYIKKQSLSFQNMVFKLRATHEMNFWEREIQEHLSEI